MQLTRTAKASESPGKLQKKTSTQSFGTGRRESHDSSSFYKRKLFTTKALHNTSDQINTVPQQCLDRVFLHTSEDMHELPDNSVALMVTSPPYNVGKVYDRNLSLGEYRLLLKAVFSEVHRVLVPGGRACVNVANLGRKPYIPLHSYIIEDMLDIGYLMRGEIIWNKASSASPSTAWGSWLSAANPTLRDIHEYILVFCKQTFTRKTPTRRQNTISKNEFLEFSKSVWTFPAESARKVGHPAPFPIELPYRLIQFYTFKDEVILDPFVGSGSTCIAALKTKRFYVGYDIDKRYVDLAEDRIKEFLQKDETERNKY